jgi:dipeptidyl aminopeptidase/acylaminoacyl peptidase
MRRRIVFALLTGIAVGSWGGQPGSAQSQPPMGIVDFLNVPRLSDPRVSPDGRDVLFTRADSDWKSGKRITHIWRARIGGGEPLQMTNGAENDTSPRWSPDGKTVAFIGKRGDNEFAQIYLLPIDGGEARQLTTHAAAVSEISWSPDGASVYFSAPEPKTDDDKAREMFTRTTRTSSRRICGE